jgi:UDP-glucose 4-epimerase
MQKILIIGGAGFIGYHLAKKLKNKFKIDLIDNFSRGYQDKDLIKLLKDKNIKLLNIDFVKNQNNFKKISKNYSYIFHFAAIVGVKNVLNEPYDVLAKNFLLLKNAIYIASKQKNLKRFIFTSSSEVYYGTLKNYGLKFPTKENTNLSALNLKDKRGTYMLSKIYGEAMCAQSGLPYTIVRPHNFYGPRMGLSHVVPELLKKAHFSKNKKISIFSPSHRRNFCYIEDGINLILSLIYKKKSLHETFNVGHKQRDITINNLAKRIIKITNKKLKIKKEKDIYQSPSRRLPDVAKALKLTSFKYKYNLDLGLKLTYEWYSTNIFNK